MDKLPHCIIVDSTVTALCTAQPNDMCNISKNQKIVAVSSEQLSISGTVTTTNIVMANWSKEMWQNVVNKAVRMLASGRLDRQFFSALLLSTELRI
ncbi:hypothetical protein KIN20_023058 [Parelaphostrongylus tenuis]|uniref:Uncharacterized protein n=1 Tax=Parelaphostrongylus tenuis TaxID=148309 RepID=A0AAD5QX49_PARTN|nr:hypothetical protein KIN20_023058 [Parelaphostrongylus tenuis]